MKPAIRLAIVVTHPIQYYSPLFRAVAKLVDLTVFYAHHATHADQAKAGFGVGFDWDIDLFSGYQYIFMHNMAKQQSSNRFAGCDTPDVGAHLREGHFDAVVVFGWHSKTYLQATFAARFLGLPVLARSDSQLSSPRPFLKRAMKTIAYPLFLRLFHGGLYVGEMSHKYWRYYRFPEERLFLSPHCVDTGWFSDHATAALRNEFRAQLGLSEHSKVVLFVGKLVLGKRPLDLIAAAALLKAQGHEIITVVAGAGPLEQDIIDAAHAAGVRLHLLGFRNQTEMPKIYAAADVLVLPSAPSETWGLVANEALACGCPVVLSDKVGGAPELVGDGTAGSLFPSRNIEALAAAINKVLSAPPSKQAIRAKSLVYSPERAASYLVDGVVTIKNQLAKSRR